MAICRSSFELAGIPAKQKKSEEGKGKGNWFDAAVWNGCFSVVSGGFFTGKGRKTKGFGVWVSPEFGGCQWRLLMVCGGGLKVDARGLLGSVLLLEMVGKRRREEREAAGRERKGL
uniref:Uncharacterized protein n=1 Tax=Solanum lycopersicum TaxID=4081 RepID=A0A3Q7I2C1_SOLLC